MPSVRRPRSALFACVLACLLAPAAAHAAPLWPYSSLQLGLVDNENGAAALKQSAPFGFRYHYLSGGVNTPQSWQLWGRGNGDYVTDYVADSAAGGMVSVFTYYEMRQSQPGTRQSDEATAVLSNLNNRQTMRAYFEDLRVFLQRAAATGQTVILHIEPDLWGYVEQQSGGDATKVPAMVTASGMPDLQGLPNTVAGFAKAIVQLRDNYASNVLLGWHLSIWGTGKNITATDETESSIDALASQAAAFYHSLGARFDSVFAEFADRDAGSAQTVNGKSTAWWDSGDFGRHVRFLADFHSKVGLPIALWQIPLGNTLFRAMNNTPHHWQDNRVEWLLATGTRQHLVAYAGAGVTALLFGNGQGDGTCACDAAHDGITNPAAILGNRVASLSADDDGGYFRSRAAAYYAEGPVALPQHFVVPKPHARPSSSGSGPFSSHATVSPKVAKPGWRVTIHAAGRSPVAQTALFDIEVSRETSSTHIFQRYFDRSAFRVNRARSFDATWTIPKNLRPGDYVVNVGVFGPGFGKLRHWHPAAARIHVIA